MESMLGLLKNRRKLMLDGDASMTSFANKYYSGSTYTLWKSGYGLTSKFSKGVVLDAGSGRGGWRTVIEENSTRYEALDIQELEGGKLDWVADLTRMPHVPSNHFDSAVCHQVLEHIAEPMKALQELNRVLKPGGCLTISVPHLSRLHELPHDYFRYTPIGLKQVATKSGFEIVHITSYGGVLTFLHHQFSTMFIGLASGTLLGSWVASRLNAPVSVIAGTLDRLIDRNHLMPTGVIAVIRKPLM